MKISNISKKGQTTIPSSVRKALNIKPHDKIAYFVKKDLAVIKPIRGNILDFEGKFTLKGRKKAISFKEVRKTVQKSVSQRIVNKGTK